MKVNDIFYSLQGEGYFTGIPAVFLRLSGCNLSCPFCDTLHQSGEEMTVDSIVDRISAFPTRHLVVTGGEPAMQLTEEIIDRLHQAGFYVQIETNGTLPLPSNIDWVTCSPKLPAVTPSHIDEIKLVFKNDGADHERSRHYLEIPALVYFLQPMDASVIVNSKEECEAVNASCLNACVDYIKEHPQWRLSLQTHKLLHIP